MSDNRVLLLKLLAARRVISELMDDPGVRGVAQGEARHCQEADRRCF